MNPSKETMRERWGSVLSSVAALIRAMERYGQSLEEFLTENNTNNTNNTTDDTDNTEEIETSDEESGFHTPDSVCVAQEVVKKCAGQCVSFFFYGRN